MVRAAKALHAVLDSEREGSRRKHKQIQAQNLKQNQKIIINKNCRAASGGQRSALGVFVWRTMQLPVFAFLFWGGSSSGPFV